MAMRVSVRDGGVTSAAAVVQAMSLAIIIVPRAAMRFDAEAMRFKINVIVAQLVKLLEQHLIARASRCW